MWIRFVLVPGLTDDPETSARSARSSPDGRTSSIALRSSLHQLGKDKWHSLGLEYHLEDTKAPTPEATEEVRNYFRSLGLRSTDAFP